jgi:hypothetical protein
MGWTDISASRKDADSPLDEDLISDLDDNTTYNHDRAIRSGTHATGVRTCMARGRESFSGSAISTIDVPIDFTAQTDGDPNFGAEPIVCITLEENTGGDVWAPTDSPTHYIADGSLTTAGCTVSIKWLATKDFQGWVHWIAIGTVTTGE